MSDSQLNSKYTKKSSNLYSLVVFPDIWMMHLLSFPISLELKGRTLTATFTEAVAMLQAGVWASRRAGYLCGYTDTHLAPAQVDEERGLKPVHAQTGRTHTCPMETSALHRVWSTIHFMIPLTRISKNTEPKIIITIIHGLLLLLWSNIAKPNSYDCDTSSIFRPWIRRFGFRQRHTASKSRWLNARAIIWQVDHQHPCYSTIKWLLIRRASSPGLIYQGWRPCDETVSAHRFTPEKITHTPQCLFSQHLYNHLLLTAEVFSGGF